VTAAISRFVWAVLSDYTSAMAAEMWRYLHQGTRPPTFPAAGRQRFDALWRSRPEAARIELTEFWTVHAFRCASVSD